MISKVKCGKKLDELIKCNKADESIYNAVKEIEEAYKDTKKKIKKADKNIEELEQDISSKKKERFKIAIYNVKAHSQLFKEISELKKQYKQLMDERNELENLCNEKQDIGTKLEKDIESQYVVFQENEIYIKAVEKIEKKKIDLPADFYSRYFKHVNQYLNTMYSIEKDTKLKEPNPSDLAILLNVLKRDEELNKGKTKATAKKKTSSKKSTVAKKTSSKATASKKSTAKTTKKATDKTSNAKTTTRKTKSESKVIVLNNDNTSEAVKKATKKKTSKATVVNQ